MDESIFNPAPAPGSVGTASPVSKTASPAPSSGPETVSPGSGKGSPPTLPAGPDSVLLARAAGSPAIQGKRRKDGLIEGSQEAIDKDRAYERQKKQRQRDNKRAILGLPPLPPKLSPALGGGGESIQAPPYSRQDSPPISGPLLDAESGSVVLWKGEDVGPAVSELIGLYEDFRTLAISRRLKALNFPSSTQREFLDLAKIPEAPKNGISKYGGNVGSQLINKTGISAEYKDMILIIPSVAALVAHEIKLFKRLDELAANMKAPPPPPPAPPAGVNP